MFRCLCGPSSLSALGSGGCCVIRVATIVVHGPAGVGKTELVRRVLANVRIDHRWYLVTPAFSPTVDTLLRALKTGGVDAEAELPLDSSPLGQLEAILRGRTRKPSIIVLDSVERLLDDDHKLTDLALDEALDLIATGPRHGVKVMLISSVVPMAGAGGTWVDAACRVAVDGLPLDYFRTFVERSAGGPRRPAVLGWTTVGWMKFAGISAADRASPSCSTRSWSRTRARRRSTWPAKCMAGLRGPAWTVSVTVCGAG